MDALNNISRILLVDDDSINNFYNESLLRHNLGFKGEIAVCLHGQDAMDYLKNEGDYIENGQKYPTPDLILLDINMPIMDGFEFLDAYDALPKEKKARIIIVMLTSSLNEKDRDRASTYKSLTDYISKPLDADSLQEVIKKYL